MIKLCFWVSTRIECAITVTYEWHGRTLGEAGRISTKFVTEGITAGEWARDKNKRKPKSG